MSLVTVTPDPDPLPLLPARQTPSYRLVISLYLTSILGHILYVCHRKLLRIRNPGSVRLADFPPTVNYQIIISLPPSITRAHSPRPTPQTTAHSDMILIYHDYTSPCHPHLSGLKIFEHAHRRQLPFMVQMAPFVAWPDLFA